MTCSKVSQARRLVILHRSITFGPAKTSGLNILFSERLHCVCLCDTETQKLKAARQRWAAERQDKTDKLV
jgi:hypothetical protein